MNIIIWPSEVNKKCYQRQKQKSTAAHATQFVVMCLICFLSRATVLVPAMKLYKEKTKLKGVNGASE